MSTQLPVDFVDLRQVTSFDESPVIPGFKPEWLPKFKKGGLERLLFETTLEAESTNAILRCALDDEAEELGVVDCSKLPPALIPASLHSANDAFFCFLDHHLFGVCSDWVITPKPAEGSEEASITIEFTCMGKKFTRIIVDEDRTP